jgi:hypothetical protein
MEESGATPLSAYPTDPGSAGSQDAASATAVAIPTVLPKEADIDIHTLPGALQAAREVSYQQRFLVMATSWAKSVERQLDAEKTKADHLQRELEDCRVSHTRLEERLDTARRVGLLETFASVLGGASIGVGTRLAIEEHYGWGVFCLLLGLALVGIAVLSHRPWVTPTRQ